MSTKIQSRTGIPKLRVQKERVKLYYDSSKHITTLATASMVLGVNLYQKKLLENQGYSALFIALTACFLLSTIASLIAMFSLASAVEEKYDIKKTDFRETIYIMIAGFVLFWFGLAGLGVFALLGTGLLKP